MNYIKLTELEQFEALEKGQQILVKWSDYYVKHTQGCSTNIKLYKIYENKERDREIICQKRYNHYFNYGMFVEGRSVAQEVCLIVN